MKIIFIGSVIPSEETGKFLGCSIAGNKMQLGVINGFSKLLNDVNKFSVLSSYPIASYPTEKKVFIGKKVFSTKFSKIVSIPFINLPYLKSLTQQLFFTVFLLKSILTNGIKDTAIITYNAYIEVSWPVLFISRLSKIPVFCLLADPPLPSVKYKGITKTLSKLYFNSTRLSIKLYDGLIVLNENAHKYFGGNLPLLTIHGGISQTDYAMNLSMEKTNSNIKTILFGGALIEPNGIEPLLKAFHRVRRNDVKLVICGNGPLKHKVIKQASIDNRINYMGTIDNEEFLSLQKKVDFLINPRPVDNSICKVTFPSKIFEYLMSGTPVLSTKLDCLVDGYSEYLNFIGDEERAMATDINEVLEMDSSILTHKADKAKVYIYHNKNWDIQTKMMYDFIKSNLG